MMYNKLQFPHPPLLKKFFLFALVAVLALTGCSSSELDLDSLFASVIRLEEFEGEVYIETDEGVFLNPEVGMKLQSGYKVHTKESALAYVSLDDSKAIQLDALTSVEVIDDGKNLQLTLTNGQLFFNVSEPLNEDETMNIQTSNMITGIRGTAGYVSSYDENGVIHSETTLLTGKVSIQAFADDGSLLPENTLEPGHTAVYDYNDTQDKVTIMATPKSSIPSFVKSAVEKDDDLQDEVGDFDDFDDDSDDNFDDDANDVSDDDASDNFDDDSTDDFDDDSNNVSNNNQQGTSGDDANDNFDDNSDSDLDSDSDDEGGDDSDDND